MALGLNVLPQGLQPHGVALEGRVLALALPLPKAEQLCHHQHFHHSAPGRAKLLWRRRTRLEVDKGRVQAHSTCSSSPASQQPLATL